MKSDGHTGKWIGRNKMAWSTWSFSAMMMTSGMVAIFKGLDGQPMIDAGAILMGSIIAIMVGGKVVHDNFGSE